MGHGARGHGARGHGPGRERQPSAWHHHAANSVSSFVPPRGFFRRVLDQQARAPPPRPPPLLSGSPPEKRKRSRVDHAPSMASRPRCARAPRAAPRPRCLGPQVRFLLSCTTKGHPDATPTAQRLLWESLVFAIIGDQVCQQTGCPHPHPRHAKGWRGGAMGLAGGGG